MNFPRSLARKTPYGFKAVAVFTDGRTYVTRRSTFKSREEATAHAERWIVANYSHDAHVRKYRAERRFDEQFRAYQAYQAREVAP